MYNALLARFKDGSYFAACRSPQAAQSLTYFNFLCISTDGAIKFPAFHLRAAFVWTWTRLHLRTHKKTMRHARCNMRVAACGILWRRSQRRPRSQIAARMPHGFSYVCTRNRVHIHTNAARKWNAGNFITPLVEMQRNLKYVKIGAAWGYYNKSYIHITRRL